MTTLYNKRTVSPNITPIPIPAKFQPKALLKERESVHYANYFYAHYMAVEGDKKLIIRHAKSRPGTNSEIIVNLTGYWNEYERPEIEKWFDSNFSDAMLSDMVLYSRLQQSKEDLINYLYDYFHNEPAGKRIMELVKSRTNALNKKLDRQDAPHSDKIIRETAERIKAKYKIFTVEETGEMLYYKDGVCVPGAEIIIQKEAQALFQYDMRNQLVNEVIGAIRRSTYVSETEFDSNLFIINFKDCLYNVKTKQFLDHTPDYLSRNQKTVKLKLAHEEQHKKTNNNGSVYPQLFGKFLGQVLYPNQIRTMTELFAYVFYRSNPHELYVNQWGYGSNGKGVMMSVLRALNGMKNVSNIALKKLITDKFAVADLTGKDANIDDEASAGTITDNTILKKLTGNQPSWVQRKNQQPYETVIHAKLFFTCNELPDIIDSSDGRYRREITIVYPNKFVSKPTSQDERQEDPDLEDKLTKDELELSRIANMCMDILHRILFKQNKRVRVDMSTINERKKHRQIIKNHLKVFTEEVIEYVFVDSEKDKIYKDELYVIYKQFCKFYNIPPRDDSYLGEELRKIIGKDKLSDDRDTKATLAPGATKKTRRRYWKGIKVKEEWLKLQTGGMQKTLLLEEQDEEEEEADELPGSKHTEEQPLPLSILSTVSTLNHDFSPIENEKTVVSSDILRSNSAKNEVLQNPVGQEKAVLHGQHGRLVFDDKIPIEQMIEKAMKDTQGNNKGYFTKYDWVYTCMIWPNLRWIEDQAEQVLHALIEEGKIQETELGSGKFKPTTEKRESRAL